MACTNYIACPVLTRPPKFVHPLPRLKRAVFPPARALLETVAATPGEPSPPPPPRWGEFSALVSGEWEGYASDFAADGSPLELPHESVPAAFRDWGLALFAWQSHSSTEARPDGVLGSRTVRFFPTVGCDSLDPPVYSRQDEVFGVGRMDVGVLGFCPDGSFAVSRPGRSVLTAGAMSQQGKVVAREHVDSELTFELEHCLVAQDSEGSGRARVRVLQGFTRETVNSIPRLKGLTLFRERWVGEYAGERGGDGGSSFAEGPAVGLDAVEGRWLGKKMVARFSAGSSLGPRGTIVEMQPGGMEEVTRHLSEEGAIFLPQGVWSRVLPTPAGGLILKTGWLVEADRAIVSRFDFSSSGQLEDLVISTETRLNKYA